MTEPTQSWFDEELARFARGEVTPEEARELAQASLASPAWFEELTATALAKTAVSSVPASAETTRRAWWRSPFLLATATSVIVIGGVVASHMMRTSQSRSQPIRTAGPQTPAVGAPAPTLAFVAGSAQPILLAESLQTAMPEGTKQIFRGSTVDARTPRQTGAIISVEDGQATINLGSADGLSKGSQVEVFRDRTFKNRVGTLRLATVFREQARGDIEGNDLRVNYAVRVADRDHLQALLQQAKDFEARGDLAGARHAAAQANAWSKSAKVTAWQKAGATELLAKLDFQAKDLGGAETHYREALDIINTDPHASPDDLAEIRNNLAALAMMRKDYSSAEKLLEDGIVVLANQKLKAARANNLGVLAETRGDREQAESFYTQALAILPQNSPNERKIAEANLNRVKGLP